MLSSGVPARGLTGAPADAAPASTTDEQLASGGLVRLVAVFSRKARPRELLARLLDPRDLPVGGPMLGYLVTRDMRLMAADAERMLGVAAAAVGVVVDGVRLLAGNPLPPGPAADQAADQAANPAADPAAADRAAAADAAIGHADVPYPPVRIVAPRSPLDADLVRDLVPRPDEALR